MLLSPTYFTDPRSAAQVGELQSWVWCEHLGMADSSRKAKVELLLKNMVIEKPDLTVVFHTDIAASCVPVYANQTWSFLHMILSTGPQSLVNLRTSSTYCVLSTCLSLLCILIYVLCIFKYRTSMPNRLLCCIHSLNGH